MEKDTDVEKGEEYRAKEGKEDRESGNHICSETEREREKPK